MDVRHVTVVDPRGERVATAHRIRLSGDRVVAVEPDDGAALGDGDVDGRGLHALPGLVDCHVHLAAYTADEYAWSQSSPSYVALSAAAEMRATLERGFTTVRDAGGADYGLGAAVADGLAVGPRVFHCGKALSQTGGHGDLRPPGVHTVDDAYTQPGIGRLVDGADAMRRAAREEIRRGASHLKLMVSGGVSSPSDPIDAAQLSDDEITAAVDEARRAGIYVAAHAYGPDAVRRALALGVRSVEHGNLIDAEAAAAFVEADAFYVPTLVAYTALRESGASAGMPPANLAKVETVADAGVEALRLATAAGARIAFGTDLLGGLRTRQNEEFRIRAGVQSPWQVLRSATSVAADLLGEPDTLGTLRPGAHADVLLTRHDPTVDVTHLASPAEEVAAVVSRGRVVLDRR